MKDRHNPNEEFEHSVLSFWLIVFAIFICLLVGAFNKCQSQTKQELLDYMDMLGVEHKEIVLKQCLLETGNLTSDIYKENHNLFGMKEATQRTTTALGTNRNHAYYTNWKSSIIDYLLWQRKYFKGGDYLEFLQSYGYATSENYIKKLKEI